MFNYQVNSENTEFFYFPNLCYPKCIYEIKKPLLELVKKSK